MRSQLKIKRQRIGPDVGNYHTVGIRYLIRNFRAIMRCLKIQEIIIVENNGVTEAILLKPSVYNRLSKQRKWLWSELHEISEERTLDRSMSRVYTSNQMLED